MNTKMRPLLLGSCATLALLSFAASAQQQPADDPVLTSLVADVRTGEAAEAELRRQRDQQLADVRARDLSPAQREAKIKSVLETYRRESSKLVAQYRQPLMEELQRRNPGLQDSMGTTLYLTDDTGARRIGPDGKPVLNPDFRGWSGDHDMQGSPAVVQRVRNALAQQGIAMTGAGSADLKTLTPGDLSADRLEMTINLDPTDQHWRAEVSRLDTALGAETDPAARARLTTERNRAERAMWAARQADSMLTPGDSAHETVARVAAGSKETYVVASMGNGQIARRAVAVNDHYKKAVAGFALNGDALMDSANEGAFQGMVKGTGKALKESGLDDAALQGVLSRNGLLMTPQQYRKTLDDIKKNPVPDLYGLNAETMESFRRANAAVMDEALIVSGNAAREELTGRQTQLAALDARIAQSSGQARTALAAERERLGREYIDSQVKLQAVEDANAARRAQYGLETAPRQTRVGTPAPASASSAAQASTASASAPGTGLGGGALKALDAAGKAADFLDYLTTTLDEAEKVVSEASPEDSDAELIARTTFRSTMRVTGMGEALETAMSQEDLAAFKQAANAGNYGGALFEWSKMMGNALFQWTAKKVEGAVIEPVKNVAEASRELWLLGGAVVEEGANYLRNVSEQEAQSIRIAAQREEAARAAEVARALEEQAPPSEVRLVSLLDEAPQGGDREPLKTPVETAAAQGADHAGDISPDPSVQIAAAPPAVDVAPPAVGDVSLLPPPAPAPQAADASVQRSSQPSPSVAPFTVSVIKVRHELYTGPLVEGPVVIGGVVAMTAELTEEGPPDGAAEWFINGASRKKRALSDDNALGLRLDTTGMAEGAYAVALKVTDAGGTVRAESQGLMTLKAPVVGQVALGAISAHRETYDGPALDGAVRNGEIVAFTLPVTIPEGSAGGTVRWQVYGPGGAAISALAKEDAIAATSRPGFRFRPEGLEAGSHEVRASFLPADKGQTEHVASASFAIADPPAKPAQTASQEQTTPKLTSSASGAGGVKWLTRIADPKDARSPNDIYWTIDGRHLVAETFLHNRAEGVLVYDGAGKLVAALGDADNEAYDCIGATAPDKLICKDRVSRLANGSRQTTFHMRVYNLGDRSVLQDAGHSSEPAFSPNGQRMAVVGLRPNPDRRHFEMVDLILLDAARGGEVARTDDFAPRRTPDPEFGGIYGANNKYAMFSGDGKVLIVLDEQEEVDGRTTYVHLVDGVTGSLRNTVPGDRFGAYFRTVSPDGRFAFIKAVRQDHSDVLEMIDLARANVLWTAGEGENESRHVFSTDGKLLHSVVRMGENDVTGAYEIRTRDAATGNIVQTRRVPMSALLTVNDRTFDYIAQLALHPDGKRIAVEAKYENDKGRLYVFGTLE